MIKIYDLKPYIKTKIQNSVNAYLTDQSMTANIKVMDYEPDNGSILSFDLDGLIYLKAPNINFEDKDSAGFFKDVTTLSVLCVGYGFPIASESGILSDSVAEAENRSQILTSIAYAAIMDLVEKEGTKTYKKTFNSDIVCEEWKPLSIQKSNAYGSMTTDRGIVCNKIDFAFNFTEDSPFEPLGEAYTGSDIEYEPVRYNGKIKKNIILCYTK